MTSDKKQILKHLVSCTEPAALHKLLPHCSPQQISKLATVLEHYRHLDADIRQKQDNCRAFSRQIGEAKKQGTASDDLMNAMRSCSAEIKNLGDTLQALETQILMSLSTEDEVARAASHSPELPQNRQYPDTHFDGGLHIDVLRSETIAWNHYVDTHPAASLYHLAQWRDLIHECFGHESYYYYAHDRTGTIKGILPLVRLKSRLFGDFMVSMPYFNYGGAIGDHPEIEHALVQHANQCALEMGLQHIEYRDDICKPDTPARTDKVNMILPLPADEESLWQSFSPKLRSQIKRPQREQFRVELGGLELIDDFYSVFARNMRDLGTPVYAKTFFTHILRTFPGQSRILTIFQRTKPVACAFLIGYKEVLEIPWASTIRSVNHLSVNMLMYWEVLRFAIRENYTYFDFGRSSVNSGTYKFKKQWGAQAKQLYWHYWLNNREMPSLNPSNPKFKLMINIWKRLPIWLTTGIGPMIVKNLP